MMKGWTYKAEQDRDDIFNSIVADSPRAELLMDGLYDKASATPEEHPKFAKPGLIPGTREMFPHKSYRLVYEIDGETLACFDSDTHLWPVAASS